MRRAIYQLLPRGVSSCGVGQVQLKAKSSSAKSNWSSKIATRCKRRLISAERPSPTGGQKQQSGVMGLPVKQVYLCNLREQRSGDVEVNGCEVTFKPLGHCKFATVYIEA